MSERFSHILLAEDDEDDVELFQSALLDACPDVKLTVANNGVELLNVLPVLPKPNLIVLDVNMPKKSGKECLLEIRKMKKFDDVPVVILSTSSYKEDIDFCLSNGADNYLQKPPCVEDMKKIVEMLCAEATGN
ncbi:MAG TPA: response regulator [Segetibacter sp.]|nr:response regulator [Segetibacter sp.]